MHLATYPMYSRMRTVSFTLQILHFILLHVIFPPYHISYFEVYSTDFTLYPIYFRPHTVDCAELPPLNHPPYSPMLLPPFNTLHPYPLHDGAFVNVADLAIEARNVELERKNASVGNPEEQRAVRENV